MSTRSDDVLTPEERRNGWTEQRLAAYLRERDAAVNGIHALGAASSAQTQRRVRAERGHDPLDW